MSTPRQFCNGRNRWCRYRPTRGHRAAALLAGLLSMGVVFPATAETADAEGYAASVDLDLDVIGLGTDAEVVAPTPVSSGSGSDSFGPINNSVAGLSVDLLAGTAGVSTGLLSSSAQYSNASQALATGGVDSTNIDLDVLGLIGLSLTADAIGSTSQIDGSCGALTPSAASTLANAQLTVLGTPVALAANPAPNTGIDINALGLAGVTLVLNEQVVGGDGITSSSIVTNALRLTLNINIIGVVSLSGEIILGHSEAAVSCNSGDLSVSVTSSPSPGVAGSPLTYTITVSNSGPDAVTDVDLQDVLSIPGTASVDSTSATDGGSCTASALTVDCNWPSVPAGGFVQATVVVTPGTSGASSSQATVGGDDHDPNGANNQFVLNDTVDGSGGPGGPGGPGMQAIPTLSQWALAALALFLAVLGAGRLLSRSKI